MIKFENTEVMGWEAAIRGMRNPMNSWEKSDSEPCNPLGNCFFACDQAVCEVKDHFHIGPNDLDLMKRLRNAGTDHRKFMRMITVYVDLTAPLYWWKEFDTYKVGTVANSCSTMHKIAAKEFTLEDFSCEHVDDLIVLGTEPLMSSMDVLNATIKLLNAHREAYLKTEDKNHWWQMIQLLPSSYNQRRTVMLNYEVLANIYKSRKDHKLDEWCEHKEVMPNIDSSSQAKYAKPYKEYFGFCDWIKTLPYSELITEDEQKVYDLGKNMLERFLEGVKGTPSDDKGE